MKTVGIDEPLIRRIGQPGKVPALPFLTRSVSHDIPYIVLSLSSKFICRYLVIKDNNHDISRLALEAERIMSEGVRSPLASTATPASIGQLSPCRMHSPPPAHYHPNQMQYGILNR